MAGVCSEIEEVGGEVIGIVGFVVVVVVVVDGVDVFDTDNSVEIFGVSNNMSCGCRGFLLLFCISAVVVVVFVVVVVAEAKSFFWTGAGLEADPLEVGFVEERGDWFEEVNVGGCSEAGDKPEEVEAGGGEEDILVARSTKPGLDTGAIKLYPALVTIRRASCKVSSVSSCVRFVTSCRKWVLELSSSLSVLSSLV